MSESLFLIWQTDRPGPLLKHAQGDSVQCLIVSGEFLGPSTVLLPLVFVSMMRTFSWKTWLFAELIFCSRISADNSKAGCCHMPKQFSLPGLAPAIMHVPSCRDVLENKSGAMFSLPDWSLYRICLTQWGRLRAVWHQKWHGSRLFTGDCMCMKRGNWKDDLW